MNKDKKLKVLIRKIANPINGYKWTIVYRENPNFIVYNEDQKSNPLSSTYKTKENAIKSARSRGYIVC